jgi:hypothetical protein
VTFRPEEVEKEGATEDRGDVNTDEDVEGGDADEIVIVDGSLRVLAFHELLLVYVVCGMSLSFSTVSECVECT